MDAMCAQIYGALLRLAFMFPVVPNAPETAGTAGAAGKEEDQAFMIQASMALWARAIKIWPNGNIKV